MCLVWASRKISSLVYSQSSGWEAKYPRRQGVLKRKYFLSMDPGGLFLNASLRVRVSQDSQPDLSTASPGPEFKAMDSTLQRGSCFCGLEKNLYPKPQMFP